MIIIDIRAAVGINDIVAGGLQLQCCGAPLSQHPVRVVSTVRAAGADVAGPLCTTAMLHVVFIATCSIGAARVACGWLAACRRRWRRR